MGKKSSVEEWHVSVEFVPFPGEAERDLAYNRWAASFVTCLNTGNDDETHGTTLQQRHVVLSGDDSGDDKSCGVC